MSQSFLHYLPILTTVLSLLFGTIVLSRARSREGAWHLWWWGFGILVYGLGTFTESWITLAGWNPVIFKLWYISGAIFGGAPLAQGTIWYLLKPTTARRLTYGFLIYALVASICVLLSPITTELVQVHLPSGRVLTWQWVRLFSPFLNTYALIFLAGGAGISARRFARVARNSGNAIARDRFLGNVAIALGALLPGFGGMASRAGATQWLYLGELTGIILIWMGFHLNTRKRNEPRILL